MHILEVTMDFAASHIIEGHPGKCARLHGHNWTVAAQVECTTLNDIGIGMDFADLKAMMNTVIMDTLDHRHLNDISPFDQINPTAENVSKYIFEELTKHLPNHVRLNQVSLNETDRCRTVYKNANTA